MILCKQCGVELDVEMQVCPLCNTSVLDGARTEHATAERNFRVEKARPALLMHVLWQIACVLLLSGIVATLIINLSIIGRVTWSIYPVTICLILLSYATIMALWRARVLMQVIAGWILSSALLVGIGSYTGDDWPLWLAFPILSAINVTAMLLILALSSLKIKGLNVLAIMFVAVAVLCLMLEGILSLYFKDQLALSWSVIVAACLLPVTAAIVFMYFRTRNNRDLQKIFHT